MERIERGLEEIRRQRNLFQELHASNATIRSVSGTDFSTEKSRHLQLKGKGNTWRLSWVAAVLAAVIVAWLTPSVQDTSRVISDVIIGAAKKISASTTSGMHEFYASEQGIEKPHPSASSQNTSMASGAKRPGQTDARGTADPHDTHITASAATATPVALSRHRKAVPVMPASTTSSTDFVGDGESGTQKPPLIVAGKNAENGHQVPLHSEQPAANAETEGQWVVNLVSSSNKAYADLFMEKARTRNIDTEQQQVTVKGSQYWRVQIGGIPTAAEARAIASTAKERLGLKDVWITTR